MRDKLVGSLVGVRRGTVRVYLSADRQWLKLRQSCYGADGEVQPDGSTVVLNVRDWADLLPLLTKTLAEVTP